VNRWIIYQKERFPLHQHGPLVFAFSFSALIFSRLLRGEFSLPSPGQTSVAFFTALLFFLQLRIADEFKDFEEDSRYRPYRPVPRGLVNLRELATVFALCAILQLLLALWLYPPLLILLGITWLYLAAMSKEFFVRDWLTARPITYLWSHMLIMPLIDLYATSCDWLYHGAVRPPNGIIWFLVVSFFNGVLIEFGRKIRAPEDEETGVNTYSALWGPTIATRAWLGVLTLNLCAAALAASRTQTLAITLIILIPAYLAAFILAARFLQSRAPKAAKRIELASGLWTLAMYLTLGPVALGVHYFLR
jgi:4-hydroxybenzoate polyprenyltransferase